MRISSYVKFYQFEELELPLIIYQLLWKYIFSFPGTNGPKFPLYAYIGK